MLLQEVVVVHTSENTADKFQPCWMPTMVNGIYGELTGKESAARITFMWLKAGDLLINKSKD